MDDKALCYKASLLNINESTIKVTVEERSESFMSVLTLSDSYFSLTLTEGVNSFLRSVSIDKVVGGFGEYTLYSSYSDWVTIRENSVTTDLKIESKYNSVIFPCPDNIKRRILSHLKKLSGLFESRGSK